MSAPVRYEVRVEGHLDPHWAASFGDLDLAHDADGTTTLQAVVRDQAELHGLLGRIRDLGVTLVSALPVDAAPAARPGLSRTRLNLVRAGYLFMGVGLVLAKWPQLPEAHTLPLFEGVTLCLLTAMSLLALLGLLRPVRMLPLLLLECAWKVLWLSLVALPRAVSGDLDAATADVVVSCSLVVVILAVVPWRFTWRFLRSR